MHPEVIKHLLQMDKPSHHLTFMANSYRLDSELYTLIGVPQDVSHHPEGDAFIHTLMVLDEAAEISARENLNAFDNAVLRLSALCHDMGKATHTQIHEDGRITAYGHPEAGVLPAKLFLERSKVNQFVIDNILPLINLHMAWVGFYTPDITSKAVRKLVRKVYPSTLGMLALLVEADMSGRGGKYRKQGLPARMQQILDVESSLSDPVDQYPEPIITGDMIMQIMGIEPSPLLGKIKAALYQAQLNNKFTTVEDGIYFLQHNIRIE